MAADPCRRGRQQGWLNGFFYVPFSSAHYRSFRHQVLIIGAAYDRCGSDGAVSTGVPHHLIRFIHLTHPHYPRLILERRQRGRPSSFKQATASWHPSRHGGSSAHHLIQSSHPVMKRLARRLVSCVSGGRLAPIYRVINEDGMRTK